MTIKCYINGTERTEWVKLNSCSISRDINGHSSCRAVLEDKQRGFRPTKGHAIKFSDGGSPENIYFAGNIFRISEYQRQDGTLSPPLLFDIECVDYNHILSRRLVWGAWENKTLYTIVNHINTYFMADEDITITGVENPGPTITEALEFRGETVQSVFSRLSAITGYLFYVDFTKDLQFSQFSSNAAPFDITDSTGDWKAESLRINRDDNDYRNRQHERSELTVDSTLIDEYTATAGQTLYATTAPIIEVRRITVDGVDKTFTYIDVFGTPPVSGYDFYYIRQTYNLHALDWSAAGGEQVVIEYLGEALAFRPGQIDAGEGVQVVTVNDTAEQTARASLSGGSGIWEAIEEQRNISSAAALRAIGEGRLRQYGSDVIKIQFTTIKDDAILEPGQRITVNVTANSINASFFIERCEYSWILAWTDYFETRVSLTSVEPFGRPIGVIQKLAEYARIGPPKKSAAGGGGGSIPPGDDRGGVYGPYIIRERPKGVVDGTNRTFYLTYEPEPPESLRLSVSGLIMLPLNDDDYALSAATITYTAGCQPKTGEEHYAWYFHGGLKRIKSARRYDGNDKVDWGNSQTLNLHADMSLGVWLKLPSSAVGQIIGRVYAEFTQEYNAAYELVVAGSSDAWDINYLHDTGSTRTAPAGTAVHTFNTNLSNDTWYYICFSRDATAKTVSLYKGSLTEALALVESWAYVNNPDGGTNSLVKLLVGDVLNGPGAYGEQPLVGTIEEYYIWDRTLTLAEHELAMAGEPPEDNLLLACITGASPEEDISNNGFSGTVTGTELVAGH